MICWRGTHTQDWAAWAQYHRELAALERGRGNEAVALKHDAAAAKYGRKAAREQRARGRGN